jgi:hypothetical protein
VAVLCSLGRRTLSKRGSISIWYADERDTCRYLDQTVIVVAMQNSAISTASSLVVNLCVRILVHCISFNEMAER